MISDKKRSSHRLSSLFSLSSNDADHESGSVASSESSSRLTKAVKSRLSSAQHLSPDVPPPPPPQASANQRLTITPVDPASNVLQPPPPLSAVSARSNSPMRSPMNSRPGTPTDPNGGLLAPNEGAKKIKRRSKLFGGPSSSDERVHDAAQSPLAWVVGHKAKVSYNLTMLLNGEKVSRQYLGSGEPSPADVLI